MKGAQSVVGERMTGAVWGREDSFPVSFSEPAPLASVLFFETTRHPGALALAVPSA